jgi:hypothetical protein
LIAAVDRRGDFRSKVKREWGKVVIVTGGRRREKQSAKERKKKRRVKIK